MDPFCGGGGGDNPLKTDAPEAPANGSLINLLSAHFAFRAKISPRTELEDEYSGTDVLQTAGLLILSNIFMTYAWYGHA